MFGKTKEAPKDSLSRIPIYKSQDCLGEACEYYSGTSCISRMELLEATGKSGGEDKAPLREECSYALYGQVCMGGEEQVVVRLHAESPNQLASSMELVARMGRLESQHIVLTTPNEAISFQ